MFVRLIGASFLFGCALGILHDVGRLLRLLIGAQPPHKSLEGLYGLRLPIVGRPLKQPRESKLRRIMTHLFLFCEDLLWFAVAGAGVVILNYYFNDGKLRLYTIVALLIGFLCYYFTVGKLVMFFSSGIVFLIRSFFLIVFCIICKPIAYFVLFFGKNAKKIAKKLTKSIAKTRRWVYNKYISNALLQDSENGFLPKDCK